MTLLNIQARVENLFSVRPERNINTLVATGFSVVYFIIVCQNGTKVRPEHE